jgi:hypothetical protein
MIAFLIKLEKFRFSSATYMFFIGDWACQSRMMLKPSYRVRKNNNKDIVSASVSIELYIYVISTTSIVRYKGYILII